MSTRQPARRPLGPKKFVSTRTCDEKLARKIRSVIRASFQRTLVDLQSSFFSPLSELLRAPEKPKPPDLEADGRIRTPSSDVPVQVVSGRQKTLQRILPRAKKSLLARLSQGA